MKKIVLILLSFLCFLFITPVTYANSSEVIIGPEIIHKQMDKVLTLSQINALYTSDSGVVQLIEENYVGYGDQPGIYNLKYSVNDAVKSVQVKVVQTLGNVIAVTDYNKIHVFKNITLSNQDIIDVLTRTNFISFSSTTEISILSDNYHENANTPGIYNIEFKIATTSGFEETYSTSIVVSNKDSLIPDVIYEDKSMSLIGINISGSTLASVLMGGILIAILLIRRKNKLKAKKV